MNLFTVTADLKPLVAVLARIADALDRQYPAAQQTDRGKMILDSDLQRIEDEELWKQEIAEEQERGEGSPAE